MERIAFIIGDSFIYWRPIILALAAVAAICIYCAVYVSKGRSLLAAAVSVAISILIGMPMARLIHWYCRTPSYESLHAAMTDYTKGDYALLGVFVGCFLAAVITRLLQISKNLPKMLDSMAIGGGVGIAVGRLASLFNSSDRGMIMADSFRFPITSPVANTVSGAPENRLAIFMIQSMLVSGLVVLLLLYMLPDGLRKKKKIPDGDIFLIFLLAYCATQAICDSPRIDSLYFRSNRFVSVVQIFALLGLLVPVVIFSVRMVKRWGLKIWQFPLWLAIGGLLGYAGYMEYYVQRHENEAPMAYQNMARCLLAVIALGLLIRFLGLIRKRAKPQPEQAPQAPEESQDSQEFQGILSLIQELEDTQPQAQAEAPEAEPATQEASQEAAEEPLAEETLEAEVLQAGAD